MGRELVIQLAAEGASVAACDINRDGLAETARLASGAATGTARVTTHECDVSVEADVLRFRDEVVAQHRADHVNLLFNIAGVGGGGGFIKGERRAWDRTFAICWGGVYNSCRAFTPLLVASDDAYLVNMSSVNGFFASIGPGQPHTAYSAAKFAVKGFTEALIEDFRVNAPHVKVAVVMPGHIGTDLLKNSRIVLGGKAAPRRRFRRGANEDAAFRETAPMTAAEASTAILDGVRAGKWRILVGDDAVKLDESVRADPEAAYGESGLSFFGLADASRVTQAVG
jgi:NAD(P)-dependent dehydrogenase (short-subunit alcohol dehydrogenase family)